MRNLGFIPVRGGSKRLPNKNILDLDGKSITHRAIDAALESRVFDTLVVSTDDENIIEHCVPYKDKILIDRRDPNLAQDKSTVRQVIIELLKRYTNSKNSYDTVTIMLATCPFRNSTHIKDGFKLYENGLDAVISVTEYDFAWELSMELDSDNSITHPIEPSPLVTGNTRTQDRKMIYHPNGAFFICNWDSLLKNENYFVGKTKGYVMERKYSHDIDEKEDFLQAEFMLKNRLVK